MNAHLYHIVGQMMYAASMGTVISTEKCRLDSWERTSVFWSDLTSSDVPVHAGAAMQ